MRMWKVIGTVSLLLATTSFGAIVTSMKDPATGLNTAVVAPGGTITIDIDLSGVTGTDGINTADIFLKLNQPTALHVVDRAVGNMAPLNGFMALATVYKGDAATNAGGILDPVNPKDAGMYDPFGDVAVADGTLCSYTFEVDAAATYPIEIQLMAAKFWDAMAMGVPSGTEVGTTLFTITPEPASMLLLAAGAAFFARRRRA